MYLHSISFMAAGCINAYNNITIPSVCPSTDWLIEHGLTSAPTQYRLYGRQFLQVKKPNQQYQSTERKSTKEKSNNVNNQIHICIHNERQKKIQHI